MFIFCSRPPPAAAVGRRRVAGSFNDDSRTHSSSVGTHKTENRCVIAAPPPSRSLFAEPQLQVSNPPHFSSTTEIRYESVLCNIAIAFCASSGGCRRRRRRRRRRLRCLRACPLMLLHVAEKKLRLAPHFILCWELRRCACTFALVLAVCVGCVHSSRAITGASPGMSSHGTSRVSTKQSAKAQAGSADHVLHLIGLCKDAFSSFKPSMTTVDAHIDE